MRKTVDLTKNDIEIITEYQKRNGLKNFSEGVRYIVRNMDNADKAEKEGGMVGALNRIEKKIDALVTHTAPKSAGEVD